MLKRHMVVKQIKNTHTSEIEKLQMTTKEYNNCVYKYSDDVYRFVVYSGMDKESAKDIVQDAFMSLWQNHSDVDVLKSKSYLFSTAYNLVNSSFRHIDVERRYQKEVQTNVDIIANTDMEKVYDTKDYLYKMMENIPDVQKSALILKDIEGYSYKEIASILKLSIQQVEVYIYRARIALKKKMIEIN